MTARNSLLAALVAVLFYACDTERNIAPVFKAFFSKYYGEDGNQTAVDLAVSNDGSLIMLGKSESQTNPVARSFIVKTDGEGTVLWQRQLGGDDEEPVDVEIDSQNDILVVSNIRGTSIRITRISQSGAGIDSMVIAHESGVKLVGTAITEVADGSFLITGYAGPELVIDFNLQRADVDDLLIYRVDPGFDDIPEMMVERGGEHVGKIVKLFQSQTTGPIRYYTFGDSDRPFNEGATFRRAFEVNQLNDFFVATQPVPGPAGDEQVARQAIEMTVGAERGYLVVGTSGQAGFTQIFLAQYVDARPDLLMRFSKVISNPRPAEGISVAYGDQETMFVLADELQDNNNHDIYLVKLASDGSKLGELRFGSIEGDDLAAAVRVLPDGRVAVLGTIALETQKKMMLTLLSPQGTFSE